MYIGQTVRVQAHTHTQKHFYAYGLGTEVIIHQCNIKLNTMKLTDVIRKY